MKKHFYKINVDIYNTLIGMERMNYLLETEILLDPFRYEIWWPL